MNVHFWQKKFRLPIFLLTILTITPSILLILFLNIKQLNRSRQVETENLRHIAKLVAAENLQINEGVRQLLISASLVPEIKDSRCQAFLAGLLNKYQRYSNFAIADYQGNVICSAIPTTDRVNIANRYSFNQTLANNSFTVGEYSISKITNSSTLNFGYPLDSPRGVIYASLDLNWLNELISSLDLKQNYVVIMLDKNGTVLARNPESEKWVGKHFPKDPLVEGFTLTSGTLEASGIDGVKRIYSYEKIGNSDSGPYIAVGVESSEMIKITNKDFLTNILVSLVAIITSLVIGWYMGNYLITRIALQMTKVDQIKRDFVSLVTHQLRTPLTTIKYFSQILLSSSLGKLNSKQKEFLTDMLESTNRLITLVGTFLSISKIESGEPVLNRQTISVTNLIKKTYQEYKHQFSSKKLKVKLKPKRAYKVYADPKLISQVIANLLINAAKYAFPNSEIDVNISKKDMMIIVGIKNQGIGIKKEDKDRIFSKFYRSDEAKRRNPEGSGLGLYLSKLIIEAHGGKIWLTNNKDITCFYFSLPLN